MFSITAILERSMTFMVPSNLLYLVQELKDQVELLISVNNIEELGGHNPIVIFIVIIFNHNLMLIASSLWLKRPEQSQGAPTLSKGRSP